jgi:hypothetical protein
MTVLQGSPNPYLQPTHRGGSTEAANPTEGTVDAMEAYFECITTCSLEDGECVTQCVEQLRECT